MTRVPLSGNTSQTVQEACSNCASRKIKCVRQTNSSPCENCTRTHSASSCVTKHWADHYPRLASCATRFSPAFTPVQTTGRASFDDLIFSPEAICDALLPFSDDLAMNVVYRNGLEYSINISKAKEAWSSLVSYRQISLIELIAKISNNASPLSGIWQSVFILKDQDTAYATLKEITNDSAETRSQSAMEAMKVMKVWLLADASNVGLQPVRSQGGSAALQNVTGATILLPPTHAICQTNIIVLAAFQWRHHELLQKLYVNTFNYPAKLMMPDHIRQLERLLLEVAESYEETVDHIRAERMRSGTGINSDNLTFVERNVIAAILFASMRCGQRAEKKETESKHKQPESHRPAQTSKRVRKNKAQNLHNGSVPPVLRSYGSAMHATAIKDAIEQQIHYPWSSTSIHSLDEHFLGPSLMEFEDTSTQISAYFETSSIERSSTTAGVVERDIQYPKPPSRISSPFHDQTLQLSDNDYDEIRKFILEKLQGFPTDEGITINNWSTENDQTLLPCCDPPRSEQMRDLPMTDAAGLDYTEEIWLAFFQGSGSPPGNISYETHQAEAGAQAMLEFSDDSDLDDMAWLLV